MTGQPQLLLVQRRFWALIAEGMSSEDAAVAVGVSITAGRKWFRRFGEPTNPWSTRPEAASADP